MPDRPSKPQPLLQAQVFVSLLRAADALARAGEELLKPAGLTGAQYNVLRILQGAGAAGLACNEVGCRLIARDPDITRLLDRMESRGLISRARQKYDRRVVKTFITAKGTEMLAALENAVEELHRKQFRRLSRKEQHTLWQLLERTRGEADSPEDEARDQ